MSAEVSPRTETASVWTEKAEMNFIKRMGTGTGGKGDKYLDRSALTDWDRLLLRRRLLVRYINALGRRSRWEPKTHRAPMVAHARKVLEEVNAAIEAAIRAARG